MKDTINHTQIALWVSTQHYLLTFHQTPDSFLVLDFRVKSKATLERRLRTTDPIVITQTEVVAVWNVGVLGVAVHH